MRTRALPLRVLAFVAISSCTLLSARAATAGAAHTFVRPESFNFEAKLPSSDGYSLYLRADDHRHIEIDLGSENNEEAPYITGDYETTGRVDRHGIDVDFGQFGHIDLHFAGSPKRQLFHSPNCKGAKPEVFQYGEMEGTVEFESLGGTVKLHTDRVAEGQTSHAPKRTCTPKPSRIVYGGTVMEARRAHRVEKGEGGVTTVMARAHTMGRTIDIYAFKLNHEFVPDMAATSTRRFGNVLMSTSVHAPDGEEGPGEAVKWRLRSCRRFHRPGLRPFLLHLRRRSKRRRDLDWPKRLRDSRSDQGTQMSSGCQGR
jgi:hypothetical protein